ncbi:MAG: nucleotide pyrophosphohydrolase [Burkholderiales bacterium]|nr:MAG: nucleotide pyrophosphohydrolase [Burkholderiales bacterium]
MSGAESGPGAAPDSGVGGDPLIALRDALRGFAAERDWEQFHAPKNLAAALSVEAAELLEPFQWLSEAESQALPPETHAAVRLEMADVLLYLVRLADRLDVDLAQAARDKLVLNAAKYPVGKARGTRTKYDAL